MGHAKFVNMNLFLMWQDRALSIYITDGITSILRQPSSPLTGCWTIPSQIAFVFLKHDMQNCCFVTLTC